jgi:hypothetical protein
LFPLWGKYGPEIVSRSKVHRVIEAGISPDSSLEAFRRTVEFTKKLHLQPALTSLNNLSRKLRTG